jgi:DNA polymerase-3 subunit beta
MTTLTLTKSTTALVAKASLGDWIAALKVAGVGISTRPPVPTLAGVLIESKDHRVTVSGFDYESYGIATVAGSSAPGEGRVLVHYRLLLDMLTTAGKRATKRVSDAWDVTLRLESSGLTVSVDGSTFNLAPLPLDEYPTLPAHNSDVAHGLPAATFIRRMDSALISASTDDTLPILTGIKLEMAGGFLSLLSTDRYRLTMAEVPVYGTLDDRSFLLGAKLWKSMKKVLSPKGSEIRVEFHPEVGSQGTEFPEGASWITFQQGDVKVGALQIQGQYPKIRSLFPDDAPVVFEVDADHLAACVASVSVVAERNTPIRFTYNGVDSLRVDAGTGEDAQGQAFLLYKSPKGNRGYTAAFNPAYLIAALKDLKGQTIQFGHAENNGKPAAIYGVDAPDVKHLVMPVRLPNK